MLRVVCRFSSPACTLLSNSRWRPMSCSRDAAGESGREKYSPLWCVKRVLMSIAKAFVDQGMIPDRSNLAKGGMDCCAAASEGCLQNYMAVPDRLEYWDSLHPCTRLHSNSSSRWWRQY